VAPANAPSPAALDQFAAEIRRSRRPILVLGVDLDPSTDAAMMLAFVEHLGVPVVVTPKAKGILPEDHPLFCGVCAGVAADGAILDFFGQSDLLVGIGYDPVESDKLWHQTMNLVSLAPVSIAAGEFRPRFEVTGNVSDGLAALLQMSFGPFEWSDANWSAHRDRLLHALQPRERPSSGLSAYEVTRRLRSLYPRETLHATDVGSIKFIVSQAWTTYEGGTFFVSNGLSSMSYGLPAAMAAKLAHPERPVLCTIGDGGFGMTMAEIETCVRRGIHFVTVVYNDSALSLIRVVQANRGYPDYGVGFGPVDVAAIARGLGAWARRVGSLDELDTAVIEAQRLDRPAVIEVPIDPAEYREHNAPAQRA
jgi:acetolactate synthase-1/2/3 large subunit